MTDAMDSHQPGDIQPPPLAGIVRAVTARGRRNAIVTAAVVVVVMAGAVILLVQGQDPSPPATLTGQAPTATPFANPTPTPVIEATPSASATPDVSASPATPAVASPVRPPEATASNSRPTPAPDPLTPPATEQGGREVRNAPAEFAVFLTLGSKVIAEGAVSVTLTVRNDSTSAQSFTTGCSGGQLQFGLFLDGTYQGGGSWGGCPTSTSTFTLEPGQSKSWTGELDRLVGYRGIDEGRQRLAPGRYGAFGFLGVTSEGGGWRTPGIVVEVR